jgi:(E)-4-hydroxy-3-methylbut-2-enyl-diphosphate synthase
MSVLEHSPTLSGPASERLAYAPPYAYRRRPTREVFVGDVGVGGSNPIRVQSMTTTRTQDVEATLAQIRRLVEVGCEIVRITAPTVADARAIGEIRRRLRADGIRVPLVADIHFSPAAAIEAAAHVEKVRVNPGNYADSKTFAVREYSDAEYAAELERIRERFAPLVLECKRRGAAMRIGTNHGSLSDRIMNRFGDTPHGMVESALEFVRIGRDLDYHEVIFSMKASNPKVMIQAYRLLVARLDVLGWNYPLHLGVTEAGGGEDGRIKSAVGIGALLDDGLGDTVRVSLTEDPEAEVPVAFRLVAPYNGLAGRAKPECLLPRPDLPDARDPYTYTRRPAAELPALQIGGSNPTRVALDADVRAVNSSGEEVPPTDFVRVRGGDDRPFGKLRPGLRAGWTTDDRGRSSGYIAEIADAEAARAAPPESALLAPPPGADPSASSGQALAEIAEVAAERALPLLIEADGTNFEAAVEAVLARSARCEASGVAQVLALRLPDVSQMIRGYRLLAARLAEHGRQPPLHLIAPPADELEEARLETAVALGSLLCDGIGDSVEVPGRLPPAARLELTFNVLQGAGARITRTEYVACPSCGRTLFDLQETTARIRGRTGHLQGVKIAVMGCVVNGPGEMADADFGYVGGAPGRVNLYVGKEVVERHVPQEQADARLLELIKARGRWSEPPS